MSQTKHINDIEQLSKGCFIFETIKKFEDTVENWEFFAKSEDILEPNQYFDADAMKQLITESKLYYGNNLEYIVEKSEIEGTNFIVGINEYQRIGWIYELKTKIYYFYYLT